MAKKDDSGMFSAVEEKLKIADRLIAAHEENVARVLKAEGTPPEELQKQLMQTFNAAIRSFKELDKELLRHIKRVKEQLRREKDRVITKIYE
mgnify:FL=1